MACLRTTPNASLPRYDAAPIKGAVDRLSNLSLRAQSISQRSGFRSECRAGSEREDRTCQYHLQKIEWAIFADFISQASGKFLRIVVKFVQLFCICIL